MLVSTANWGSTHLWFSVNRDICLFWILKCLESHGSIANNMTDMVCSIVYTLYFIGIVIKFNIVYYIGNIFFNLPNDCVRIFRWERQLLDMSLIQSVSPILWNALDPRVYVIQQLRILWPSFWNVLKLLFVRIQ